MKRLNSSLRRVLVTATVAGVVAAVIGGVSLARAGGAQHDQTLKLTEVQTSARFVDITHTKGGAPGDEFIFHSRLVNGQGDRVGALDAMCTLVLGGKLQCMGTFRLPGGTLAATALIGESAAVNKIAIVGGTGRYDHVHGQIASTSTGDTTNDDVIDLDY